MTYVPLLGVHDGMATVSAHGSFADNQPWEQRGLGRFLLYCVQVITCEQAKGCQWSIELQSCPRALAGWLAGWLAGRAWQEK